ncbi:hypothetical protein RQP46_009882 [Phenoliferia psychrophenolica]
MTRGTAGMLHLNAEARGGRSLFLTTLRMSISKFSEFFPPASKITEADLPDLSGKVCIVTGGNTGIGKETVRVLYQKGAKVYLAARSEEKAKAAIIDLTTSQKDGAGEIIFLKLDLETIKGAKAAAEQFLNGLLCPKPTLSPDGYELTWAVCVLGPFAFTETLIPLLKATAAVSPPNSVRIVTVSSAAHYMGPRGGINLKDQTLGGKVAFAGGLTYGQAKLGNIIIANYWAAFLKESGIISTSVHPGGIRSDLQRSSPWILKFLTRHLFYPTSKGAITQLYAATSHEVTLADSGAFFVPWARRGAPRVPQATEEAFIKKVIEVVRAQVEAKL